MNKQSIYQNEKTKISLFFRNPKFWLEIQLFYEYIFFSQYY